MTTVFARYREGTCGETARVCHVLHMPDEGVVPAALVSLCGKPFPAGVLELMPQWAGMPCLTCTVLLPDGGPGVRAVASPGTATSGIPPGNHVYGAAFTDEPMCHIVPARTPRRTSLGRTVAVSECGHLAYDCGDGSSPDPPADWAVCPDCVESVTVRPVVPAPHDGDGSPQGVLPPD